MTPQVILRLGLLRRFDSYYSYPLEYLDLDDDNASVLIQVRKVDNKYYRSSSISYLAPSNTKDIQKFLLDLTRIKMMSYSYDGLTTIIEHICLKLLEGEYDEQDFHSC